MTDLRKAAEMAIEAIMKGDVKEQAEAVYALRQALAQPEPISYVPGFYRGEKISLSRVKLGERFVLVRTGQIYSKTKYGFWNISEQRLARLHLNCQVQIIQEKNGYPTCPPCTHDCNEGRDCPARKVQP